MNRIALAFPLVALALACSKAPSAPATLPESYLLPSKPAATAPVASAVATAKDGDDVVLVGRVGGSAQPIGEDRAWFTLVDESVKTCAERGESCPRPWDYCCEEPDVLAKNEITVEFHDANGVMKVTPKGFHGLDDGKTVVVKGKAKKAAGGTLQVIADGLVVL